MEEKTIKVVTFREIMVDGRKEIQVLLVLEKAEPEINKDSMWGCPGGRPESGDKDKLDTARREVDEEAGISFELIPNITPWEDSTRVFLLARYTGGELKGETRETYGCKWVPYQVLFDVELRGEYCSEGIYPAHAEAGRQLLDQYWRVRYAPYKSESLRKGVGQDTARRETIAARSIPSKTPTGIKLRPMTEEEVRLAAAKGRAVYCRINGKFYKGNVTSNRFGYGFVGRYRTEEIRIMEGITSLNDFLCEE